MCSVVLIKIGRLWVKPLFVENLRCFQCRKFRAMYPRCCVLPAIFFLENSCNLTDWKAGRFLENFTLVKVRLEDSSKNLVASSVENIQPSFVCSRWFRVWPRWILFFIATKCSSINPRRIHYQFSISVLSIMCILSTTNFLYLFCQ